MRNARFTPVARVPCPVLDGRPGRRLPADAGGDCSGQPGLHDSHVEVDHPSRAPDESDVPPARDRCVKVRRISSFLKALRALPVIGTIELDGRKVELRYAHEEAREGGAGSSWPPMPRCFSSAVRRKAKAGYELTLVELTLDAQGSGKGTMTGAARVKPTPDGGLVVDDFASAPVQLAVRRIPAK